MTSYIESLDDYVKVHLKGKTLISRENISTLCEKLPIHEFVRIHRSFIVSIRKITSFSAEGIGIDGMELPIGRAYKQKAFTILGLKS